MCGGALLSSVAVASSSYSALSYFDGSYKGFSIGGKNFSISTGEFHYLKHNGFQLFRLLVQLEYNSYTEQYEVSNYSQLVFNKVYKDSQEVGFKLILGIGGIKKKDWVREGFDVKLASFWSGIAQKYKEDLNIIAFDLLNEPTPAFSSHVKNEQVWRQVATTSIEAIRKEDASRVVVFEPAPWGLPDGFKWLKFPLDFDGVVYSFHMYKPHIFTHQGVRGRGLNVEYPSLERGWDINFLRDVVSPVKSFQKRFSVPIYIGEFSSIRYAPGDSRRRYIKDLLLIWKERQWAWTYHTYGGWDGWDPEIVSTNPKIKQRVSNSEIMRMLVEY